MKAFDGEVSTGRCRVGSRCSLVLVHKRLGGSDRWSQGWKHIQLWNQEKEEVLVRRDWDWGSKGEDWIISVMAKWDEYEGVFHWSREGDIEPAKKNKKCWMLLRKFWNCNMAPNDVEKSWSKSRKTYGSAIHYRENYEKELNNTGKETGKRVGRHANRRAASTEYQWGDHKCSTWSRLQVQYDVLNSYQRRDGVFWACNEATTGLRCLSDWKWLVWGD